MHVDVAIGRLAAARRGLVTHADLIGLGLSASAIARRRRTGRLISIHRGVYAVGHTALPALGREQAALLACGPGSVLSHHSAALVWRLLPTHDGPVHLTVQSHRRAPSGVRVHHTAALPCREMRVREGLRVTAPARTLLDLAATDRAAFERALNEALVRRMVSRAELEAAIAGRRRGVARLRRALEGGPTATRSALERGLLALVGRAELPRPQTNVRVGRWEVDALWPRQRLIVELDGYAGHSTRHAFEADRLRDAEHQAAGYRTIRITHHQLTTRPEAVTARLAMALSDSRRFKPSAASADARGDDALR